MDRRLSDRVSLLYMEMIINHVPFVCASMDVGSLVKLQWMDVAFLTRYVDCFNYMRDSGVKIEWKG